MSFPVYQNTERRSFLIPNGAYIGEIVSGIERQSKSGNPMWELKVKIDEGDCRTTIFDYILLTEDFAWKMKSLCDSLGVAYDGKLEVEQTVGQAVNVSVSTQAQPGYDPKNRIDNYLPKVDKGSKVDGLPF